jgi:hypothetical protein
VSYLVTALATVLLLGGLYALAFVHQLGAPVAAEYWVPEAAVVKLATARSLPGPKIVVVGGSNALFGVDSALIERETRRPTVNLGLHAGLSLDYLLAIARPVLSPGDVVVLSLEYGYYETVNPSPSWFSSNIMAWDPGYLRGLRPAERLDFALSAAAKRVVNGAVAALYAPRLRQAHGRVVRPREALLEEARAVWRSGRYGAEPVVYSFRSMDERGDIRNNAGAGYRDTLGALPASVFTYSAEPWERLQRFQEDCRRRGVRVVLSWPALPDRLGGDPAAIRRHLDAIRRQAAALGLASLGEPGEYFLDPRYFFDTLYHLNDGGRTIRTARLLPYLKTHL